MSTNTIAGLTKVPHADDSSSARLSCAHNLRDGAYVGLQDGPLRRAEAGELCARFTGTNYRIVATAVRDCGRLK